LIPNLSISTLSKESEDILWSDPRAEVKGFSKSARGRGFHFRGDAVKEFLEREGFELLLRSHENCREGFFWPFGQQCELL
jgi:hypothetical protein